MGENQPGGDLDYSVESEGETGATWTMRLRLRPRAEGETGVMNVG